jgi:hypothetical protein
MRERPSIQRNSNIRRERDVRALSNLAVLLCCALVLAGGFVFAARQHFAAVQYGYESENLRREREQLLEDQQRATRVGCSPIGIATVAGRSDRNAQGERPESAACRSGSYPSFRLVNSLSS